jgi:hypothetical protein
VSALTQEHIAAICATDNRIFDARSSNMYIHQALHTQWNVLHIHCPDLYMSESWGGSNMSEASSWLQGVSKVHALSVKSILLNGGNGVRIGNVQGMQETGKDRILNPTHRTRSLYHATDEHATVAQRNCIGEDTAADSANFAKRFVDELFPMAQAVSALSSSLRY